MWFKYGLKAQKLLAQGIALGIIAISKAPCKGKSLIYLNSATLLSIKLFKYLSNKKLPRILPCRRIHLS